MLKRYMAMKTLAATLALSALLVQTAWAAPVDLNLAKAVQMALDNNAAVKISVAELDAAKAQKNQANNAYFGSIGFNHQFARGGSYKTAESPRNNFSNKISYSLPIYTGGQLEGTSKRASKNYESYRYALDASFQETKLNATTGYYSVLEAGKSLTLAQESVERLESHLKNVEAQFNVGTVAKVDVLRSQVELANAKQDLIKANNAYDVAVASLNNIVGLPLHTELHVNDGLDYKEYKNTLDNCLTYASANRPEIHKAAAAVAMAKASIQIANANNMPKVSAVVDNSWGDNAWPGKDNREWSVGVGLSLNVFDFGVTAAKVAEAKAGVVKAEETYRQTTDNVLLAVRTSYLSLREAEKRIAASSVAVAQAEEDYHIAQVRYQSGVGTNTDVMDAQVALTKAKNNYVQALYDYNTSHAKLERAMGVPVTIG